MRLTNTRAGVASGGVRNSPSSRSRFTDEHAPLGGGPSSCGVQKPSSAKGAYLRSLRYAIGLIWSVKPGYVVLNLVSVLERIPSRILNVWIVQFIVDIAVGSRDFGIIIAGGSAYLAYMLVRDILLNILARNYNVAAEDRIRSDIQARLHAQAKSVDLAQFDRKEFYDDFARALDVLDERVIKCFKELVSVLQAVMSILALGGVMAVMSPPLVVLVVVGCSITVVAYSRRSKLMVMRNRAITPIMRRFQYLNDLYYQRRFAKDVRVERIDEVAAADHARCTHELDAEDKKYGRRSAALTSVGDGFSDVTDVLMYLYLAWGIISGSLAVGSFMALSNAAWSFSANLRTLFRALPELGETCLLIADAHEFDGYTSSFDDSAAKPVPLNEVETLTMRAVGFSYEVGRPVLEDITFEVHRGQMLAIVGHNGAGKTTLAKLLLRLYDPNEGSVLLNGIPYDHYRAADLRAKVAVVFQDYQHYAYSLVDNVLMRPCEGEADRQLVRHCLAQVGLLEKVERFEGGIDAHVTKEFSAEGELFSGGELQRLAIARALAKDAPIVVFDEPSSALDPLAEREVLDLMQNLFADRICVVISHRLSMTRDADCILVMEGGHVVEAGTHDQLVAQRGSYADLWEAQAGKYRAEHSLSEAIPIIQAQACVPQLI